MAVFTRKGRKDQQHRAGYTLTAVALQDHLTKQLSLTPSCPAPPRRQSCRQCGKTASKRVPKQHTRRKPTRVQREEYVLDTLPATSLSLAQRLGLVEAPTRLLTETEWAVVKDKLRTRGDSTRPCPICHGEFGTREQVLLSCSHTFHLVCLQSFEKFSQKKTCPLCRCHDYQSRVIVEGFELYKMRCAIRIQAAWRGYVTRKWYHKLRETVPPSHPSLRRKYFEKKLSVLTDRVVQSCTSTAVDVDRLMAEADMAMSTSRQVMRSLNSQTTPTHWDSLRSKVMAKGLHSTECPVCLCYLAPPPHQLVATPPNIAVLSCGHVLHLACIQSLEDYCNETVRLCPLCRSPYHRQLL